MERDFNNDDDFELFLKQKADQHKLFPSDKVWRGINNSLHPGMRWVKIGGSLLIATALVFIFQETNFRGSSNASIKQKLLNSSSTALNSVVAEQPGGKAPVTSFQTMTFNNVKDEIAVTEKAGSFQLLLVNSLPAVLPKVIAINNGTDNNSTYEANDHLKGFTLQHNEALKQDLSINVTIPVSHVTASQQNENTDIVAERELATTAVTTNTLTDEEDRSIKDFNWLQEIAAIKLTPQKKSRFNLQFYFSPTISYRRLVDNQNNSTVGQQNILVGTRDNNVNKYVDQNASIGAELGSNVLFSAGRNLTIKSGLQLNYSRYNIKAFKFYYEKASIALNTAGPVADTISSYTSYRNFSGYSPEQLQNQYLQVSVPIGAELKC